MKTQSVTEQWDSMHNQIDKQYTDIVVQLQSTLAIGDYEELFFKFFAAMKDQTHWALFEPILLILQNTYDSVIEDIYG